MGGIESFYNGFFIGAVYPLGFLKEGKNLNYYDSKELEQTLREGIIRYIKQQLDICGRDDQCFCLGEGKNFKYLQKLNREEKLFGKIVPLAHPRYIMQYKHKYQEVYIEKYKDALIRGQG